MNNPVVSDYTADALFTSNRVLVIAAHPDDIEFYCAATICAMVSRSIDIRYLIATKGDHGLPGIAGNWMRRTRTVHQKAAASAVGVNSVDLLDYPDGNLQKYEKDFATAVSEYIFDSKPDCILCWDPIYPYNPHPDHVSSGNAVVLAKPECEIIHYGTTSPDLIVPVNNDLLKRKFDSLACHKTEVPPIYFFLQKMIVIRRMRKTGKFGNISLAEGFRTT